MSSIEGALSFESQRNSCFLSNALWHSSLQPIQERCCLAGLPPIDEAFLDITNPNEAFALLSERSLHLLEPPASQAAGPQSSQAQVSPNGGLPPLHNYLNDRCTHGAHMSALDALHHLMHLCTCCICALPACSCRVMFYAGSVMTSSVSCCLSFSRAGSPNQASNRSAVGPSSKHYTLSATPEAPRFQGDNTIASHPGAQADNPSACNTSMQVCSCRTDALRHVRWSQPEDAHRDAGGDQVGPSAANNLDGATSQNSGELIPNVDPSRARWAQKGESCVFSSGFRKLHCKT